MIDVHVLASSSAGNCYHITDGSTPLLIEAGIPFKQIREGVRFQVSSLAGVLISHEHGDHSKAAKDLLRAGVDVYASQGTIDALGLAQNRRVCPVRARDVFALGTWAVLPFDAVHDAQEPLGYLLASGEDKLLYLTDSAYCKYRFAGLTTIMLECNYSLDLLRRNVAAGKFPLEHKNRVLRNHMGIDRVLAMLAANDLRRVREIYLLHLSDDNSDEAAFKAAVERQTGKPVYVARRRLTMFPSDRLVQAERQLEQEFENGVMTQAEFNEAMRDLHREYREDAREAAREAYDREFERW